MQVQIWMNLHPDGCARLFCIKIRSVFPLHKHIPTLTSLTCTSTEEIPSIHCVLQAQDHKTKIVQSQKQPRNDIQFKTLPFHSLLTPCVSRAATGIKQPSLQESLVKACRP